ncbi:MAG TPA: GSCFA domain-containing protein [Rhizomicrobium sp.]|jgi:hypothetical protein|nr:GSCFA domain-containing protein [Rhizomicrobium sp.]
MVNPAVSSPFKISRTDKIATGGSCFAQHIARRLKASGYTYLVTEDVPTDVPPDIAMRYNYGVFSARYGNIYTARQLLQLLRRVQGLWEAEEPYWRDRDRWIDPFRPFIQPRGFASERELNEDRRQHYSAVLEMFRTADVFVFTLGLTEAWRSRVDGAVFPGCPGCNAGSFDPERYEFYNADYRDVLSDMRAFIREIRKLNPTLKFIITVSPVPLTATASGEHVLSATTYSKSVLRAVAGKLDQEIENLVYFPSYEIITSQSNRGRYFGADLRTIEDLGVDHVMGAFFEHLCDTESVNLLSHRAESEDLAFNSSVALVCDEERLIAQ